MASNIQQRSTRRDAAGLFENETTEAARSNRARAFEARWKAISMTCMTFKFAIRSMASRRRTSIFALVLLAAASASCSKDEPTQEQLLSRANEAFAAQQLVEAEKGYREV